MHIELPIHFLDSDATVVTAFIGTQDELHRIPTSFSTCCTCGTCSAGRGELELPVRSVHIHVHRVLPTLADGGEIGKVELVPYFHLQILPRLVHNRGSRDARHRSIDRSPVAP